MAEIIMKRNMSNSSKALIVGIQGFIGHALGSWLEAQGVTVYGIDVRVPAASTRVKAMDVQDGNALKRVLEQWAPDVIFQLAGNAGLTDEALLWNSHVTATYTLLCSVKAACPRARIVVLGSAAEYGSHAGAMSRIAEDQLVLPDTAYGKVKLAQIQLAQKLGLELGLDVLCVRLFNTLGPGQGPHLVGGAMINRLYEVLARKETVFEVYDPDSERDYLDVRDVARLLGLMAREAESNCQWSPMQLASGEATRVLDLAALLLQVAGVSNLVELKSIHAHKPTRYVGQPVTLQRLLNDRPIREISVKDSLRDMWQWKIEQV